MGYDHVEVTSSHNAEPFYHKNGFKPAYGWNSKWIRWWYDLAPTSNNYKKLNKN